MRGVWRVTLDDHLPGRVIGMARRSGRSEAGNALVELAFALPILVLLMVAAIDFARIFYMGIALTNAARAGAQYGSHTVANSANTSGMQTAATNAANINGISANASRTC